MELFKKEYEERRAAFMSHISPEVAELLYRLDKGDLAPLSIADWKLLHANRGTNSYERKLLEEHFSDELLIDCAERCMQNFTDNHYPPLGDFDLPSVYEHAALRVYLPMLVERLKER